jgi:hypothetical protein
VYTYCNLSITLFQIKIKAIYSQNDVILIKF